MISRIKPLFIAFFRKINALNTIKRSLILAGGLILILIIWAIAFKSPMSSKKRNVLAQTKIANTQLNVLQGKTSDILNEANDESVIARNAKHSNLSKELKTLQKSVTIYKGEMLPVEKLPSVLQNILIQDKDLTLVNLKQLPTKPLDKMSHDKQTLRQTQFIITLNGSFFSILDYLKQLESVKWNLFWNSLHYEVTTYPKADATITVSTLDIKEHQDAT
jgi:MSHA biogenesis protein MshJ